MRRSSGFLLMASAIALSLLLSAFLGASPCLADNWVSAAPDGISGDFGHVEDAAVSMAVYSGTPYAGTQDATHGCEIYRYSAGSWTRVVEGGFGDRYNVFARSMCVYGTRLFVGTGRYGGGCEVWAYDGSSWSQVNTDGFGSSYNSAAYSMAVYNGSLYVGTTNTTAGGEVWRYNGSSWSRVSSGGFDTARNTIVGSLCAYGAYLFAGTYNNLDGCDVWRYDGSSWTQSVGQGAAGSVPTGPGFGGAAENFGVSCMTAWNGRLYAGIFQSWDETVWESDVLGMFLGLTKGWAHKVWSYDGTSWSPVTDSGGYGSVNLGYSSGYGTYDDSPLSMGIYGTNLLVTARNEANGCQVWLFNGASWTQINTMGFGTLYNQWAACNAVVGTELFVGTKNERQGAEVWRYNGSAWTRTAATGFAASNNYRVDVMLSSGGSMYIGTASRAGGEVWQSSGAGWSKIGSGGLTTADNLEVKSLAVYNSKLYAGTRNDKVGGQVYVYSGGTWTQVNGNGFGSPSAPLETNYEVSSMAVYNNNLWAGTHISKPWGCQVYRYDGSTWTQENGNGFGDAGNLSVTSMCAYGDSIYMGTLNQVTGCEIWRRGPAGWQQVNTDGFGAALNSEASSLAVYGGKLYAGVTGTRARVYRYDGGSSWADVSGGGLGDPGNIGAASLAALDGTLYAGTSTNPDASGGQVWRYDGSAWASSSSAGFGDKNNRSVSAMAVLGQKVYAGTENDGTGCEVLSSAGPPGSIVSITPASGYHGQTLSVAITGDKTHFSSASTVSFSGTGITVNSRNVIDPEHLTASISIGASAAPGARDVNVITGDDVPRALAGGFTVFNPRIVSVSPASVDLGETASLTITGSETKFTPSDTVAFSGTGIAVNSVTRIDDTHLRVSVTVSKTADTGARDVSVQTAGMTVEPLARGLTVGKPVPRVDSVSPSYGGVGYGRTGDAVTITGDWFGTERGYSGVSFNGKAALSYRAWSMTEVRCVVPSGATSGPLVVTTKDGSSAPVSFKVVNTIPGTGRRVDAGNSTTVTFENVTSPGNTRSSLASTPSVDDFTPVPGTARDVTTDAGYTGKVTVTLSFAGKGLLGYQEESVVLLHQEAGRWADVTTGRDTASKTVTGKVSSLSGFVVAIPAGTSAPAGSTWYLAEGSTDHGFNTYISIENPNDSPVTARVTYMTTSGPVQRPADLFLPAKSQTTINPANDLGARDFSTRVECLQAEVIAVDRSMTWTGPGASVPGAHSSIGLTQAAGTWYLPEGSSNWGFETWVTVQNPNDTTAKCYLTYMIEGQGPVKVAKLVPANGRSSFFMADDIGARDASIKVECDKPVIAERSMYRNNRREGHNSVASAEPDTDYYMAEGTTNWGFTTYVVVQNPNSDAADVTLYLMTPQGLVQGPTVRMAGQARRTFRLNDLLSGRDCSIRVHGTLPIVAERAMYWNNGTGEAMHDSIGVPGAHRVFYLPDGDTTIGRETWTTVQNPNPDPIMVEVTYMTWNGSGNIVFTDLIAGNSRKTYDMSKKMMNQRAAIMVRSLTSGKPIMVERSMYWNNRGTGTCTVGGYSD